MGKREWIRNAVVKEVNKKEKETENEEFVNVYFFNKRKMKF